ncbi:MAG: hypothetical protein R2932_24135 [Caldilineaceae bacterium]
MAQITIANTATLTEAMDLLLREIRSRTDCDSLYSVWHIGDVTNVRRDLTPEQCREVLRVVEDNHDANTGIHWEVIEFWAESLFPALDDATP